MKNKIIDIIIFLAIVAIIYWISQSVGLLSYWPGRN